MYAPLRFVEQASDMVILGDHPEMSAAASRKSYEYFKKYFSSDRARKFISLTGMSCKGQGPFTIDDDLYSDEAFKKFLADYTEYMGLAIKSRKGCLNMATLILVASDWSMHKSVYRIENNMMDTLCTMKIPEKVALVALLKMPSKCFYIDYNGYCPFNEKLVGCFCTYDFYDGYLVWTFLNIMESDRILHIVTNLCTHFDAESLDEASKDVLLFDSATFDSDRICKVSDTEILHFNEQLFVRFFCNFCLYLYSANNDVEYTERTRQVYRPRKKNMEPKNKIREVEEFGVGFRYGASISKTKKKVKYIDVEPDTAVPKAKRVYTSNYRSAHWHHYWVLDEDNPGQKKLIVKWIEATFVHGNRESNSVTIHTVKE